MASGLSRSPRVGGQCESHCQAKHVVALFERTCDLRQNISPAYACVHWGGRRCPSCVVRGSHQTCQVTECSPPAHHIAHTTQLLGSCCDAQPGELLTNSWVMLGGRVRGLRDDVSPRGTGSSRDDEKDRVRIRESSRPGDHRYELKTNLRVSHNLFLALPPIVGERETHISTPPYEYMRWEHGHVSSHTYGLSRLVPSRHPPSSHPCSKPIDSSLETSTVDIL
jgi:hypothetical protein